jgi:hypothetical protein
VLQAFGGVLLVIFAAVWITLHVESPLFVGAAVALFVGGQFVRVTIGTPKQSEEAIREAVAAYERAREAAEQAAQARRTDTP